MRTSKVLVAAAAVCGLTLMGAGSALAAPAAAPAHVMPAQAAPISVDKPVAAPGETVTITVNHGPESMNWVLSDAFTDKDQNPVGGSEGVAHLVSDSNGVATYTAVVDDVPSGDYGISVRIGGGNAGEGVVSVR